MGTSITGYLTPAQIAQAQANQAAMVSAGSSLPPPPRSFVFLAAFDGTNNDRSNVALSGSPYQTNVANIYDQAKENETNNFVPRYYPGVGTGGENGGLLQSALSPTQAVNFAAEKALGDFADRAYRYLQDNPTATYADLSASAVGFSRGGVTAVVFARLLNEQGLVLPDGTVVAPPGVAVYGLAPIDPVKSGIEGNLSIPPNVKGDVLQVVSMGEDRKYFEVTGLSDDPRVVRVEVHNNHVGSGGGDDKNGTAASVLEGVTGYLKNQGTAIADVPPDMRFDPTQPVAIRSEAYQTAANGDVLLNEDGTPKLRWPVAGTPDERETAPIPEAPDTHDPRDPHSVDDAINGHDHQSDNYLNLIDIPAPALANHFAGGNAGGAYGAGQLMGFDVLPFNQSSSFLTNADGDIVGEINILPNGYQQIKNLYGEAVYVSDRDGSRGDTLSQAQYEQASAQPLSPETGGVLDDSQYRQAAGAIGLMNSIIGLQSWSDMGGLQRLAAVTSIYNAVDSLSGGNALPGNLGAAAGTLGLLSALDQGNMGSALYSGLSLVEQVTSIPGVAGSGWVSLNLPGGDSFLPGLGFVLALDSGDPVSIVSSGLSLMSSLGWLGPYGAVIAVVATLLGGLFADDDQPMLEGRAHAEWDSAGNTVVLTDQDQEGGGATAAGWMSSLVTGLQAQLANTKDANGGSYALIPNLLPAIGYQYDPDGFNLANGAKGFLYLQWTDENGQSQTRYYDGQGSRGDDSGETLAGDFMKHAQGAIAPAWQVQTVLAHWQQGQGASQSRYQLNSCLRFQNKGYRPISCMRWQRKTAHRTEWKAVSKPQKIFRCLTLSREA